MVFAGLSIREPLVTTAADLLWSKADRDSPALLFENQTWSFRQLVDEGRRRIPLFDPRRRPGDPSQIGVLLENVPEYFFWLSAAASYGSTEGIIIIRRNPSMPPSALGSGPDSLKVINPDTGRECPPAEFDQNGRVSNLLDAVGEIVETEPSSAFEGYYRNEEATVARFRNGWYWSGDLAYRDGDGCFYFAGRSIEWLRVDGENFAAAPVEGIIGRYPPVRSVAVYAVPDDPVGDRVMAAIELAPGVAAEPADFDAFLSAQPDLGTKWLPRFVRFVPELPKLASMKIDKQRLRREAWDVDGVWWRPDRNAPLAPLSPAEREKLRHLLP
jgi:fatty-acyl-CoA synthase